MVCTSSYLAAERRRARVVKLKASRAGKRSAPVLVCPPSPTFSDTSSSSSDSALSKRESRKLRNRRSAALSRLNSKAELEFYKFRVAELERENQRLQSLLAHSPNTCNGSAMLDASQVYCSLEHAKFY
mmetsp:Transcript_9318/g.14034  ORF Transcript_9318/g.14034 Transcript_9318/m.14034 type:complete len:128 (-) Transcript_9318:282-665(-)